jgi:hypothetical protein
MLGWCVAADRIVIWVLSHLGMGGHTLVVMLDGVGRPLGSLRPIYLGILMFDTVGWNF